MKYLMLLFCMLCTAMFSCQTVNPEFQKQQVMRLNDSENNKVAGVSISDNDGGHHPLYFGDLHLIKVELDTSNNRWWKKVEVLAIDPSGSISSICKLNNIEEKESVSGRQNSIVFNIRWSIPSQEGIWYVVLRAVDFQDKRFTHSDIMRAMEYSPMQLPFKYREN